MKSKWDAVLSKGRQSLSRKYPAPIKQSNKTEGRVVGVPKPRPDEEFFKKARKNA